MLSAPLGLVKMSLCWTINMNYSWTLSCSVLEQRCLSRLCFHLWFFFFLVSSLQEYHPRVGPLETLIALSIALSSECNASVARCFFQTWATVNNCWDIFSWSFGSVIVHFRNVETFGDCFEIGGLKLFKQARHLKWPVLRKWVEGPLKAQAGSCPAWQLIPSI